MGKHSLLTRLNEPGSAGKWPEKRDVPRWVEPIVAEGLQDDLVDKNSQQIEKPVKQEAKSPVPTTLPLHRLVTVVIVNFKTKALIKTAYKSFRQFYPNIPIILVDNGSGDQSASWVDEIGNRRRNRSIMFDHNIGHGPAMHKAIKQVESPYVLTLDTDTETLKRGFVEDMVEKLESDDGLYALGWLRLVDRVSGVPKEWHVEKPPPKRFLRYIHPSAAMYRVSMYHVLAPFFHHGAPCLDNMREADKRGLKVISYPVRDYVKHLKAGTRRMYSGRWNPTAKTPKHPWKANKEFPI